MLMHSKVITRELSRRLSVMGFICTILVVMIHSTPRPMVGSCQWWIVEMIGRNGFSQVAVPYFFLVSGFLLAGHFCEDGWYKREVHKRVLSLVVPYFVWIGISLCVNFMLFCGVRMAGYSCNFGNPFYGPWWKWLIDSVGLNPFKNIGPLWFVRDLFFLVLLSPLILRITRKMRFLLPIICFIGIFIVEWFSHRMNGELYCLFHYSLCIMGVFLLGHCVAVFWF